MELHSQSIPYRDGQTELTGYQVANDSLLGKRPGILVIHGGAGLDEHARNRARQFAELGYVVFASDMYGDGVAGDRQRVISKLTELTSDRDKLCRRAQAGVEALKAHPKLDGRIAAVGYCFGGLTALELARNGADLAGVVSVHGTLTTKRPAQARAIQPRILVCHGAIDPHVPLTHVNAFLEEMNQTTADWQLIIYGNAMHGFTHEAPSAFPGVAYHAEADRCSRIAIEGFLADLFDAKGAKIEN